MTNTGGLIQVDTDRQDARHETRVVGTGDSVYEYAQAALLLLSTVGQASVIIGVFTGCLLWLAGVLTWVCVALSILTTIVCMVSGTLGFIWLITSMRAAKTTQPRDEDGRWIPVYQGGVHRFNLFSAAVKRKKSGLTR